MYVFIFLFFTFSAILETWLKIHEDLDKFVDPSPSNKAKASATAALAKGSGDGKVYNIIYVWFKAPAYRPPNAGNLFLIGNAPQPCG